MFSTMCLTLFVVLLFIALLVYNPYYYCDCVGLLEQHYLQCYEADAASVAWRVPCSMQFSGHLWRTDVRGSLGDVLWFKSPCITQLALASSSLRMPFSVALFVFFGGQCSLFPGWRVYSSLLNVF